MPVEQIKKRSQPTWWHTSIINHSTQRPREESPKFEASLNYTAKLFLKITKTANKNDHKTHKHLSISASSLDNLYSCIRHIKYHLHLEHLRNMGSLDTKSQTRKNSDYSVGNKKVNSINVSPCCLNSFQNSAWGGGTLGQSSKPSSLREN